MLMAFLEEVSAMKGFILVWSQVLGVKSILTVCLVDCFTTNDISLIFRRFRSANIMKNLRQVAKAIRQQTGGGKVNLWITVSDEIYFHAERCSHL